MKNNITLIGMAGVGKSYIGKRLADKIGYNFIKVDDLITLEAEKISANKYLLPDEKFMELEEKAALSLEGKKNCIFDTGGSVIYSEPAMEWLKNNSLVVYLKDETDNIKRRFNARDKVLVVGIKEKSFEELLTERGELYEKYADLIVDLSKNKNLDKGLEILIAKLSK